MATNPKSIQGNINTATAAGGAQAQAAYRSAPPQSQKPMTKYEQKMEEIKRGAALGVNVQEAVKAHTKGYMDETRNIKLSIKRQYFTFWETVEAIIWGIIVGAFIGAFTVASTAPNAMVILTGKTAPQIWAIMFLSFGISGFLMKRFTRPGVRRCTYNPTFKVPPSYRGRECLNDLDCTDQTQDKTPWDSCKIPKFGIISRSVQNVIPTVALFGGAAMLILTQMDTDFRPHPTDIAQAVIYGAFGGAMLVLFFSFEDVSAY